MAEAFAQLTVIALTDNACESVKQVVTSVTSLAYEIQEKSMESLYATATLWLSMAVISAIIAYHLRISIALVEICIGVIAAAIYSHAGQDIFPGSDQEWLKFMASSGAVLLTFLAGAELDSETIKTKLKEVSVIGIVGFLAPFIGCAAVAFYLLHWEPKASLLCGIALSTTSMAVVYSVMYESGLNKTDFGKGILGSCFVNDLGTVIALGLIFAPITYKTFVFVIISVIVLSTLPLATKALTKIYAFRTAAIRTKWVILILFGLGALALWSGSEAVLPAYIAGIVLAGSAAQDNFWMRRLRTLTVGLLTPFYFLRAGTLVSLSALISAPIVFVVLLMGKVVSKIFGLYPFIAKFRKDKNERWYYTLMMSTGLTFGTISALYGYSHGIIDKDQYSFLVAAVIGSAVIPTVIAIYLFSPKHLIVAKEGNGSVENGVGDEG